MKSVTHLVNDYRALINHLLAVMIQTSLTYEPMADEPIEFFDDNFASLGHCKSSEVHRLGLWHGVSHCWLHDASSKSLLYQRRGATKRLYPGKLDVSVAGHCIFGESPIETVVRESREEIGLDVRPSTLQKLGVRRDCYANGEIINREFQHVFAAPLIVKPENLVQSSDEVEEVVLLELAAVIEILLKGIRVRARAWKSGRSREVTVSSSDFIPSIDSYNLKIPFLIQRAQRGDDFLLL